MGGVAAGRRKLTESERLQRAAILEAERQEAAARAAVEAERKARLAAQAGQVSWDPREKPKGGAATLTRKQRQRLKALQRAANPPRPANDSDAALIAAVTPEALAHGDYRIELRPGPTIVVKGEERLTRMKVVLNRGGTAVDRWIARDERGLFNQGEQNAIQYCRSLWARADGISAIDPAADRIDAPLGWSEHEALIELGKLKDGVPRRYWEVFENVCRFDEEAGSAGSSLATNTRSAIDAAKTTVAFTAGLIAMRLRL